MYIVTHKKSKRGKACSRSSVDRASAGIQKVMGSNPNGTQIFSRSGHACGTLFSQKFVLIVAIGNQITNRRRLLRPLEQEAT